jgi:hypothetical protein
MKWWNKRVPRQLALAAVHQTKAASVHLMGEVRIGRRIVITEVTSARPRWSGSPERARHGPFRGQDSEREVGPGGPPVHRKRPPPTRPP